MRALVVTVAVAVAVAALPRATAAIYMGSPNTSHIEVVEVGGSCSGVFITDSMILTGGRGHCVASAGIPITIGSLHGDRVRGYVQDTHGTLDLALICSHPFERGSHASLSPRAVTPGDVDVLGYGQTENGPSTGLQKGVSRSQTPAGNRFQITTPRSVACRGDSGGPVYERGSKLVVGIFDAYTNQQRCGEPVWSVRADRGALSGWVERHRAACDAWTTSNRLEDVRLPPARKRPGRL